MKNSGFSSIRVVNNYFKQINFVKTLLNRQNPILNYFTKRLTSGFVEGVNNKIKLIKRKAYGFRNFKNFRIKIIDAFN